MDSVNGKVVGGPTVSAKGFSEDPAVFDAVLPIVTEALDRAEPVSRLRPLLQA